MERAMNPPDGSRKIAPGPPGRPIVGNLNEFREDRLRFLLSVRQEYGDVVRLQLGPRLAHLVSHPDWIRYVLATHHDNYHKSEQYRLQLVPGHPVEPEPVVTLRPREGVRVTL